MVDAEKAGSLSHGKGTDVAGRKRSPLQTLGHDIPDRPEMLARGQLGNDTTEWGVDFVLGEDDAAQDLAFRRDNGRRRLVTRCLDGQYVHRPLPSNYGDTLPNSEFG